jgi:hypothetical protein
MHQLRQETDAIIFKSVLIHINTKTRKSNPVKVFHI